MKKPNKYTYLFVLQGFYSGYGWEDLTAEDKALSGAWDRIKQLKKEYRENECGSYRIISRRELNTQTDVIKYFTNEAKQS